jgi:hypothetical protein
MALNILDMKKAVTKKLKEAFPECNIYSKRVEQGMKAPAFHVDLVPYDAPKVGLHGRSIHYFVNCTFFPTVEGDLDQNLQAWEIWKDTFVDTLELPTSEVVRIHEQKCVMMDSLYRFSFNIEETYYETVEYTGDTICNVHTKYIEGSE